MKNRNISLDIEPFIIGIVLGFIAKWAGVGGKGIKGNALRQDYLMTQMNIWTSQIDALFIDSS